MGGSVLLGIAAAAAASTAANCGVILQAAEARRQPSSAALRPSLLLRLARRPRWVAGTALTALCLPLQAAALIVAPITVVQPALALGLIVLLPLSRRMLGERIGQREIAGALAVTFGVALAAAMAPHHTGSDRIGSTGAVVLAVLTGLIALPYARRSGAWRRGDAIAASAGLGYAVAAIAANLFGAAATSGHVLAAVAWAGGIALTSIVATTSEMSALQVRPASQVVPVLIGAETLVPVALAPLVAGEAWGATAAGALGLAAGVVLVLAGGVTLASSPRTTRLLTAEA
jgi:hypothetical protein